MASTCMKLLSSRTVTVGRHPSESLMGQYMIPSVQHVEGICRCENFTTFEGMLLHTLCSVALNLLVVALNLQC